MISIEMDTAPARAYFEAFGRRVPAAMGRALRRVGTAVQGEMIKLSRERGVMRRVFGKKASGARKLISKRKLRTVGDGIEQPIKIVGLAAIQEQGGRTAPHRIRPSRGNLLVIGGKPIFAPDGVQHQGANMPAFPFADRAAQRHGGRLKEEMEKELGKLRASLRG